MLRIRAWHEVMFEAVTKAILCIRPTFTIGSNKKKRPLFNANVKKPWSTRWYTSSEARVIVSYLCDQVTFVSFTKTHLFINMFVSVVLLTERFQLNANRLMIVVDFDCSL